MKRLIKAFFSKINKIDERLKNYSMIKYYDRVAKVNTQKHYKINYKRFWGNYFKHYSPDSHKFYYEKTGINSHLFIPDGLYYAYIDKYFNDWIRAEKMDNKCLYDLYFPDIVQPKIIAKKINGTWFYNNTIICFNKLIGFLSLYEELVCKVSVNSHGGHGVTFLNKDKYSEIDQLGNDLVVQEIIEQSDYMKSFCTTSVNTIRVLTFLYENESKVLSSVIRFGLEGTRVDNACSDGCSIGVKENGYLREKCFKNNGDSFDYNPNSNSQFSKLPIPKYDEIKKIALKLHENFPLFGLISWDFAIGKNNDIILIESNFKYGELTFHQLNNGPLFKTTEDLEVLLNKVIK